MAADQVSGGSAGLSPELLALKEEAVMLEAGEAGHAPESDEGAAPGVDTPVDFSSDARDLVEMACEALGGIYPSTDPLLTPDKRAKIAAPLGRLMKKYDLSLLALLGQYEPEISTAFAVITIAPALLKAISVDRAAAKAVKAAETVKAAAPAAVPAAGDAGARLYEKA